MTTTPVRHIGIALFPDVEELDAVGPWELLSYWARNYPEDGYSVCCRSKDGEIVTAAKGLVIGAHHSIASAPPLEVLLHPGGVGTGPLLQDSEHLDWVRAQRAVVAPADQRVHRRAGRRRRRAAQSPSGDRPLGIVRRAPSTGPERRTPRARSLGRRRRHHHLGRGSAGIDMALHLVVRLAGAERARQVRRGIQYDPEPPV